LTGPAPGMARKLRVEYPGAIYHVLNREDRREPIFKDDANERADGRGAERAETGQEKADGIIAAELKRRGWTEEDLRQRPKGEREW
jgi:hypothetical protein